MGSGKKASSLIMSMSEQSVMSIQVCLPTGRYIDDPFQTLQNAAKQQHTRLLPRNTLDRAFSYWTKTPWVTATVPRNNCAIAESAAFR